MTLHEFLFGWHWQVSLPAWLAFLAVCWCWEKFQQGYREAKAARLAREASEAKAVALAEHWREQAKLAELEREENQP